MLYDTCKAQYVYILGKEVLRSWRNDHVISKVYEEFRLNQNFTMMRNNIIFFSQLPHSIRCRILE